MFCRRFAAPRRMGRPARSAQTPPPPTQGRWGARGGCRPAAGGGARALAIFRRFVSARPPCQGGSPCRAIGSRPPEAGIMLIPHRLEPHGRPWRRAAGGSCGAPVPGGRIIRPTHRRSGAQGTAQPPATLSARAAFPAPFLSAGFPAAIPSRNRPPRAASATRGPGQRGRLRRMQPGDPPASSATEQPCGRNGRNGRCGPLFFLLPAPNLCNLCNLWTALPLRSELLRGDQRPQ